MSAVSITPLNAFDYGNLDLIRKEQIKPTLEAITKAANTLTDNSKKQL